MRLSLLALLTASAALAAPVPKVDTSKSWVGKTVVLKANGTPMKVKTPDGNIELVPVRVINPQVLSETETTIEIAFGGKVGTLDKADVVRADDGVEYFTKQIEEKSSADLYLRRASVRKLRGELDDALADCDKAVELSPSSAAYQNRGQLYLLKKDTTAALADFNRSIEIDPNNAFPYRSRGEANAQARKYADALADFAKANELQPDAWTHGAAGRVYAAQKEWAKAAEQYDASLKLNPKHVPGFLGRAVARFEQADDKGGEADLAEAAKLLPNDPSVYVARASAAYRRGKFADANKELGEALRLNPKHAGALNLRAWVFAVCPDADYRDGAKAVDFATRACEETKWKAAGHLDTLAAAYAESGKWDDAIKWQKKALEDTDLLANEGKEAKERLKLYEEKKAFREEPKWKR
jgi:tetratricopeptide (TPR) repeat protein